MAEVKLYDKEQNEIKDLSDWEKNKLASLKNLLANKIANKTDSDNIKETLLTEESLKNRLWKVVIKVDIKENVGTSPAITVHNIVAWENNDTKLDSYKLKNNYAKAQFYWQGSNNKEIWNLDNSTVKSYITSYLGEDIKSLSYLTPEFLLDLYSKDILKFNKTIVNLAYLQTMLEFPDDTQLFESPTLPKIKNNQLKIMQIQNKLYKNIREIAKGITWKELSINFLSTSVWNGDYQTKWIMNSDVGQIFLQYPALNKSINEVSLQYPSSWNIKADFWVFALDWSWKEWKAPKVIIDKWNGDKVTLDIQVVGEWHDKKSIIIDHSENWVSYENGILTIVKPDGQLTGSPKITIFAWEQIQPWVAASRETWPKYDEMGINLSANCDIAESFWDSFELKDVFSSWRANFDDNAVTTADINKIKAIPTWRTLTLSAGIDNDSYTNEDNFKLLKLDLDSIKTTLSDTRYNNLIAKLVTKSNTPNIIGSEVVTDGAPIWLEGLTKNQILIIWRWLSYAALIVKQNPWKTFEFNVWDLTRWTHKVSEVWSKNERFVKLDRIRM